MTKSPLKLLGFKDECMRFGTKRGALFGAFGDTPFGGGED
jgi:hypothetical protein